MASQLRRSAVSIPSNISEGHARQSPGDFGRFLAIAAGSAAELGSQLLIAKRLNYLDEPRVTELLDRADQITRMIRSLQRTLRRRT